MNELAKYYDFNNLRISQFQIHRMTKLLLFQPFGVDSIIKYLCILRCLALAETLSPADLKLSALAETFSPTDLELSVLAESFPPTDLGLSASAETFPTVDLVLSAKLPLWLNLQGLQGLEGLNFLIPSP